MKRIIEYSIFEASIPIGLTKAQKEFVDSYVIGDYKYDYNTGLINVNGSVNLGIDNTLNFNKKVPKLPGIKFGVVSGNFEAGFVGLTSLIGFPTHVGKDLYIANNHIKSLVGSPFYVGGNLHANNNNLTNLKGLSKEIFGKINISKNKITSLKGCPEKVKAFFCSDNDLTSLEGGPTIVDGTFNCSNNPIQTMKGSPNVITGHSFMNNIDLDSFDGIGQSYRGGITTDWIGVPADKMNPDYLIAIMKEIPERNSSQRVKSMMTSFIFNYLRGSQEIENYFKENPTEIYLLDGSPTIKAEILKKTGIKDLSRLGRNIKNRLI